MAKGRRIYVVDDDKDMVDLMTVLLEARGHTVASNLVGELAIPEIVEMRPHCVLIDLMMAAPDGLALTRELAKHAELKARNSSWSRRGPTRCGTRGRTTPACTAISPNPSTPPRSPAKSRRS